MTTGDSDVDKDGVRDGVPLREWDIDGVSEMDFDFVRDTDVDGVGEAVGVGGGR